MVLLEHAKSRLHSCHSNHDPLMTSGFNWIKIGSQSVERIEEERIEEERIEEEKIPNFEDLISLFFFFLASDSTRIQLFCSRR